MMMAVQVVRCPTRRQLAGSVVQSPGMRIESASHGGRSVNARGARQVFFFLCHLGTPPGLAPGMGAGHRGQPHDDDAPAAPAMSRWERCGSVLARGETAEADEGGAPVIDRA
jgi:hypothetical protein